MEKSNFTSLTPFLILLLVVASFAVGMLYTKVQYLEKGGVTIGNNLSPTPSQAPKVNVSVGHLPIKGDKNAKVTVVEFADFQCPYCERWFKQVEPEIIKNYVDKGKVKFAFRHYAFLGQESTWAALASECANEQGKFWEYHDYLYNHQGAENSGTYSKDKLKGFAAELGLKTDQFNSCLDSEKYLKQVNDDLAEGQQAGVTATPASFVNGQLILGAQPYSTFQTLIDQELKK